MLLDVARKIGNTTYQFGRRDMSTQLQCGRGNQLCLHQVNEGEAISP